MVKGHQHTSTALLLLGLVGCGSDEGSGDTDAGAASPPDAATDTGSATGTGGAMGNGGATSAGGGSTNGGRASSGGTSAGGTFAGGSAGAGGAGPADAAPPVTGRRSAGCGLPAAGDGTLTFSFEAQSAEYVLSIPAGYDANLAYPLGFAFHGRNRTGPNCHDGDCIGFQAAMEDDAILVYMTSLGGTGWEGDGERELNVRYFTALRAHLEDTLCINEGRVFVAGTSSGAHFVNVLGCRFGDRLLATVPVAGYLPERSGCVGEVPALVIHGVDDGSFSAGQEARDFYVTRNGCATTTVPPIPELHARVVADRESHECAEYQACDPDKPVVWCEHSEGGYDGSTHGWPAFAGQRIREFVSDLPDLPPPGG